MKNSFHAGWRNKNYAWLLKISLTIGISGSKQFGIKSPK